MITEIEIKNFKKHRDFSCSFTPGVNLIVGKNWAGKSTLLWAIVYAMFGPSYVPGGAKLVSPKLSGGKPSVRLSWVSRGRTYTVLRTPDKAELHRDGELQANGASAVTEAVEALLGMSAATFTTLRMAQQNEASAILTLGVTKLSQIVDQITKVDVVDRIIKLSSSKATGLQAVLAGMAETDLEALRNTVASINEHLAECQSTLHKAKEENLNAAQAAAQSHSTWKALLTKANDYHAFELRNREARQAVATLTGSLESRLPETLLPEADTASLKGTLATIRNFQQASEHVSSLAEQSQSLQDGLELAVAGRPGEAEWSEADEEQLNASVSQVEGMRQALWGLRAKIEATTKAVQGGSCPTCHRPFEGHDPAKLQQELDALSHEYRSQDQTLRHLSATCEEMKERKGEHGQRLAKAQGLRDSLEAVSLKLGEAQKYLASLPVPPQDATYDSVVAALATAEASNAARASAIEFCSRVRSEIRRWEEAISSDQAQDPPEAGELEQAETRYYSHEAAKYQAKEALHAAEMEHTRAKMAHSQALRDLQAAEAEEKRHQEVASELTLNKSLTSYLRKNRDVFTARVWEHLLKTCSGFVSSATAGQISEVSRTQDGQFQYLEDGLWMPVGAASGVQQAILGVGVRMALADALEGSSGFLLLDEITAGAHEDLSMEVIGALSDIAPQSLIVTHRQEDAAIADHLIEIG